MNVNKLELPEFNSNIFLSAFPGRQLDNQFSSEVMEKLFDYFETNKCQHLLTLNELKEFNEFCGFDYFTKTVVKRSFDWHHMPIQDFDVPDREFLKQFLTIRDKLVDTIKLGNDIAIHCKGGLGRSGTVAAIILIELGINAKTSINRVRNARAGAIENKIQEEFILGWT